MTRKPRADSFDEVFDGFQLIEHYLRIQLINFDDVKELLVTTSTGRRAPGCREQLPRVFDYGPAQAFVERFDHEAK
jgi:hypothetical protein